MKIRNFVKRLSKRAKLFAGVGVVLGILIPAAVYAGYGPNGPDRIIYDWNNPAQHNGAFDAPRFNSYINTDVYGDERAFLDAKECVTPGPACYTTGTAGGYKDQQPVQVGKEYIVRAYVHNIANPSINGTNNDGIGVAKDTMFKVEIPDGTANGFSLKATISASNSIPKSVYDTVDLRNDSQAFDVEYVADSAYISNSAHGEGLKLSDSVVTTGTLVGYDQMNGIWPGCFDFTAFVTIRVKIKAPALTIKKQVTTPGSTVWKENLDAKKGDTVSWLINYDVTGTTVNDITVRDPIPKGLTLVPGSITWFDPNHPSGEVLPDTALGAGGVNVGNYQAGSGGAIRFRTTVDSNKDDPCVIKNVAYGRAFNVSEKNDDAKVTRTDCVVEEPMYSCDLLEVNKIGGDRKYEFKAQYTAKNGATFKSFTYDFGDGTTPLTTDKDTVDYTFAKDGSYATKVTVNFTVNGVDKSATSNACKKTINVTTPIYTCDLVEVSKLGTRSYSFKVNYTAENGATVKDITYVFGDGTSQTVTTNPLAHTYAKDGTYVSVVTVNFLVNGQTVSKSGTNCAQTITVTPENCTVPGKEHLPKDSPDCKVTVTPPVLPNTGPGDVIGIFAATSIAGAFIHRYVLSRRYS